MLVELPNLTNQKFRWFSNFQFSCTKKVEAVRTFESPMLRKSIIFELSNLFNNRNWEVLNFRILKSQKFDEIRTVRVKVRRSSNFERPADGFIWIQIVSNIPNFFFSNFYMRCSVLYERQCRLFQCSGMLSFKEINSRRSEEGRRLFDDYRLCQIWSAM